LYLNFAKAVGFLGACFYKKLWRMEKAADIVILADSF